jgi:hypothetical protein
MLLRAALAAMLGAAIALLVACGSSGGGLIPATEGGPLQNDIEIVERAAEAGNGNCGQTESALLKTDQDFSALPASVDSGLRDKIRLGIENLHKVAKEECEQLHAQTKTEAAQKTTSTATTQTQTTPSTPSTTTTTTPPPAVENEEEHGAGGGTPAPGEGNGKAPNEGAGGASPEEEGGNGGNGAGGSEGGK